MYLKVTNLLLALALSRCQNNVGLALLRLLVPLLAQLLPLRRVRHNHLIVIHATVFLLLDHVRSLSILHHLLRRMPGQGVKAVSRLMVDGVVGCKAVGWWQATGVGVLGHYSPVGVHGETRLMDDIHWLRSENAAIANPCRTLHTLKLDFKIGHQWCKVQCYKMKTKSDEICYKDMKIIWV